MITCSLNKLDWYIFCVSFSAMSSSLVGGLYSWLFISLGFLKAIPWDDAGISPPMASTSGSAPSTSSLSRFTIVTWVCLSEMDRVEKKADESSYYIILYFLKGNLHFNVKEKSHQNQTWAIDKEVITEEGQLINSIVIRWGYVRGKHVCIPLRIF